MSVGNQHRSLTIRGLVTPSSWDADDQVTSISVLTFDDDEYEILLEDAGEYLREHLRREVLVRGHLVPEIRKRKVMRVRSFTVVNPA